jgi:glucosamine-6-phosphate deaminase
MVIRVFPDPVQADAAAADCLAGWLASPATRRVMVAGGNTPLALYRRIAERRLALSHLRVFALDEYVGVPAEDPRTCGQLLRRCVADAWGVPPHQFFTIDSEAAKALASVQAHEAGVAAGGGLDVAVLGLGVNGHLGFNEPGSARDSTARVVELNPTSVEANRRWFGGDYAPNRGATVGLKTILAARRILLLAYGAAKAAAVQAMIEGPVNERCPASFLQAHDQAHVFLDEAAAGALSASARSRAVL